MPDYKEIRRLPAPVLRELCIRREWYTKGDNAEYDHLLQDLAAGKENLTTGDIIQIADDIAGHSELDEGCGIEEIAFEVARACTVTFRPAPEQAAGLPKTCYSVLPDTGALVYINRGEAGYFPSVWNTESRASNRTIAETNNRKLGVTHAQRRAMEVGCVCGWDAPGANPKVHERAAQGEL